MDEHLISSHPTVNGFRELLTESSKFQTELVNLRRQLHKHPELGFQEHQTAKVLAERLATLGYKVTTGVGTTGVVADLGSGACTVAIRAEMDAIGITELNRSEYASAIPGVSHACGHDANMSCAIGAAKLLSSMDLPRRIRVIMQPASEQCRDAEGKTGTTRMVEEHALDGVRAIIAVHVDTTLPAGVVGIIHDPDAESTMTFTITLKLDQSSNPQDNPLDIIRLSVELMEEVYHIAEQLGHDCILRICSVSSSSQQAHEPSDRLELQGYFCSADSKLLEKLSKNLDRLAASYTNGKTGLSCRIEQSPMKALKEGIPDVAEIMRLVACDIVGEDNVRILKRKTWTEDYSGFTDLVPGALLLLGAGFANSRRIAHSPTYDIDEAVLHIGATLLAASAIRLLELFTGNNC